MGLNVASLITNAVGGESPITLVYGGPGVGKTTFVSGGCLVLDLEGGASEIGARRIPREHLSSWRAFLDVLHALRDEKTGAVAVDTMSAAVELATRHILEQDGVEVLGEARGGYGRGAEALEREIRKMFALLESLRRPVILVCHEAIRHVTDPAAGEYDQWTPDLPERVWRVLYGLCSAVLRVRLAPVTRGKGRVEFTDQREVYTAPSKGAVGKNRLGLPPRLALRWQDFEAALAPASLDDIYKSCINHIADLPEDKREAATAFVEQSRSSRQALLAAKGRILELIERKEGE